MDDYVDFYTKSDKSHYEDMLLAAIALLTTTLDIEVEKVWKTIDGIAIVRKSKASGNG